MSMINGQTEEDVEEIGLKKPKNLRLRRTSLAFVESLTLPLVQEIVILADFQCPECQKRVGDIITKMNGEIESVVVGVLEKKVTLTFTNTHSNHVIVKTPSLNRVAVRLKPLSKFALIRRFFHSSNT